MMPNESQKTLSKRVLVLNYILRPNQTFQTNKYYLYRGFVVLIIVSRILKLKATRIKRSISIKTFQNHYDVKDI